MNRPENISPTLEEMVAAHQSDLYQKNRRRNWPCLDGLNKRERNNALTRLWNYLNKDKKKVSSKQWFLDNRERSKELTREYRKRNRDVINAKQRANRNTPEAKRWWKDYLERNSEKTKCRNIFWKARLDGKIHQLPCEVCGDSKSEGHHPDYSKPLKVMWLCKQHHEDWHRLHG